MSNTALVNIWRRRREAPPPAILRALRDRAPRGGGLVLPDAIGIDPPRRVRRAAERAARKGSR